MLRALHWITLTNLSDFLVSPKIYLWSKHGLQTGSELLVQ